jgi:sigma-B regulation protein RsbU (phosphoserine phosphatase)
MQVIQIITTALYFIVAGVLIFLAYSIIRDNPSQRLNRVTGLMLFFAALGPIFMAFGTIVSPIVSGEAPFEESTLYNLHIIWELFFPALLLFSWIFPVDQLGSMKRPRLRYFIFLPHIFHLGLVVFFKNPERVLSLLDVESSEGFLSLIMEPLISLLKWIVLGFTLILSSDVTIFTLINLIYVSLAIYAMIRGYRLLTNQIIKKNSIIIISGIAAAVVIYTIGYLLPRISPLEFSENIRRFFAIAAVLIGSGAITFAVIRQKFLDITVFVRQSLVYTLTSGLLVGGYILLVGQVNRIFAEYFGEKTSIVNIAFIVLALILYQPINRQLDNLISRFFIRSRTDYRNIMTQLSRSLVSVLDPRELRSTIVKTLKATLMIDNVFFVLYDDKENDYVLLPTPENPERIVIDRHDLFLGGVGQQDRPTQISSLSVYGENSRLYKEMEQRKVQLILPLKDMEHLLGFLALTKKVSGFSFHAEDISMLGVISNQLVTAITNARLYVDSMEKQRLAEEISMARQIQLDLLPKNPPRDNKYSICTYSMPSRTIGGDFYDFIPRSNGVMGMVVADASGKGIQAALIVTQIQAMLRSEIGNDNDISRVIGNINRYVSDLTSSEKFATMFYAEFNPESGDLNYSNAGHNYPVIIRNNGSHEFLSEGGMIIGAFGGAEYASSQIRLFHNDLLFVYTDGLSEAQNDKAEQFEEYGEERILDYLVKNRERNPDEIIEGIIADVRRFDPSDPPRDDTTIIAMKILNGEKPS